MPMTPAKVHMLKFPLFCLPPPPAPQNNPYFLHFESPAGFKVTKGWISAPKVKEELFLEPECPTEWSVSGDVKSLIFEKSAVFRAVFAVEGEKQLQGGFLEGYKEDCLWRMEERK